MLLETRLLNELRQRRIRDEQELVRRIRQRELHGGADEILVLLSDSAHNRRQIDGLRLALGDRYSAPPRRLLAALRGGTTVGASGVVVR